MNTVVKKSRLRGDAPVPGSKSHTIRAVLLGLMSDGTSYIHNPLPSLDCKSAMSVARCFGAEVAETPGLWTVRGVGKALKVPDNYVDCGNSGSTAYFSASIAALVDGYTFLTGDEQIRRRPIQPVLNAIEQLGGTAFTSRPGVNACPGYHKGKNEGRRSAVRSQPFTVCVQRNDGGAAPGQGYGHCEHRSPGEALSADEH